MSSIVVRLCTALCLSLVAGAALTVSAQRVWLTGDVFIGVGDPFRLDNEASNGKILGYDADGTFTGEVLDEPTGWSTTGCAYNPLDQRLYTTSFTSLVNVFNPATQEWANHVDLWGPGDTPLHSDGAVESIAFDTNGDLFIAAPWASSNIQLFRVSGGVVTGFALPNGGADWIDVVRENGETVVYYTAEALGENLPAETTPEQKQAILATGIAAGVHKYNVTTGAYSIVGYIGGPTFPSGDQKAFALRLLPNDQGILVAGTSRIFWMSLSGQILKQYSIPGVTSFFAFNLSPDAQYFWTATQPHFADPSAVGRVFKVHLASGGVVKQIDTGYKSVAGLCVVREYVAAFNECSDADGNTVPCKRIELCNGGTADFDGDGLGANVDPDCAAPGTVEVCSTENLRDENNNGLVEESVDANGDGTPEWCREHALTEGETASIPVTGARAATDSYTVNGLPDGMVAFNMAQGSTEAGYLQGAPSFDSAGTYSVSVTITRGDGSTSTGYYRLLVANVNRAPILDAIGDKSVNEGVALAFTVSGSDPDADTVTYSASGLPTGATFDAATRQFSWTPTFSQAGSHTVTFKVSDGAQSDSETITIVVANVNRPPVLAPIGPKTANEFSPLVFTISATDSDTDDTLTYSASGLPVGATFNPVTRTFAWVPNSTQSGTYDVTFTVADGKGGVDFEVVRITVNDVQNSPPSCSGIPSIGRIWPPNHQFVPINILGVTDPDGGQPTIVITKIEQDEPTHTRGDGNTETDGAGVGTSTAMIRAERIGTPGAPGNGRVYVISYTATDASGASCSGSVTVGVPHDQRPGATAVDDGTRYDSTVVSTPPRR